MDMITVTNRFIHRVNGVSVVFVFVVLLCVGCQNPPDAPQNFGKEKDLTEDLYHRLKSGIFEVGKDPVVCRLIENQGVIEMGKGIFRIKKVPSKVVRVSWERGSFRVRSDDNGSVIIHMDNEAIYSHVHVFPPSGVGLGLRFYEHIEHPIR